MGQKILRKSILISVFNEGCLDEHIKKEGPNGLRFFTPSELLEIIRVASRQLDAYLEVGLFTDAEVEKINAAEDKRFAEWLIDIRGRGAK